MTTQRRGTASPSWAAEDRTVDPPVPHVPVGLRALVGDPTACAVAIWPGSGTGARLAGPRMLASQASNSSQGDRPSRCGRRKHRGVSQSRVASCSDSSPLVWLTDKAPPRRGPTSPGARVHGPPPEDAQRLSTARIRATGDGCVEAVAVGHRLVRSAARREPLRPSRPRRSPRTPAGPSHPPRPPGPARLPCWSPARRA